jgi:putative transcriptional regulator
MALIRKSLDELKATPHFIERNKKDRAFIMDEDDAPDMSDKFAHSPAFIRKMLSLSQIDFAQLLSIPVATIRNWEQARVTPDPAARALLKILKHNPQLAVQALKKAA